MEDAPNPREHFEAARERWLLPEEVLDLLSRREELALHVSGAPPELPPSGALFLFDRRSCKRFRRDGHNWLSRRSGGRVREDHVRLRVAGAKGEEELLESPPFRLCGLTYPSLFVLLLGTVGLPLCCEVRADAKERLPPKDFIGKFFEEVRERTFLHCGSTRRVCVRTTRTRAKRDRAEKELRYECV